MLFKQAMQTIYANPIQSNSITVYLSLYANFTRMHTRFVSKHYLSFEHKGQINVLYFDIGLTVYFIPNIQSTVNK